MIYGCASIVRSLPIGEDALKVLDKLIFSKNGCHQKMVSISFGVGSCVPKDHSRSFHDEIYKDSKTGISILLSGTIHNSQELRSTFSFPIRPNGDAEFIFQAFTQFGPEFVNSLNGDFTIIIYEEKTKRLYLCRDHLGIRPLSYTIQNGLVWFSTDTEGLCRHFLQDRGLNREAILPDFKMIDFTQTYHPDVKRLLPGHYLELSDGRINIQKYWRPEKIKIDRSLTREKVLSDIKELVEQAVEKRCDPHLKAAAHLSGGLDSGIVAALAKNNYSDQSEFMGFSWSPENVINDTHDLDDERELVKEQCKMNGISPFFISLSPNDYQKYISNPAEHGEFFQENKVLEVAHQKGIDLILSGYGGDEFISKGDRGIEMDLLFQFQWRSYLARNPIKRPKRFIKRIVYEIMFPFLRMLSPAVKKAHRAETAYLKKEYRTQDKKTVANFFFYTSRRKLHLGFLSCYYLPIRMEDWFIQGHKFGIEYRYPLLDKEIVEYILTVPSKFLCKGEYSRSLLREMSEGILPESVRWKKSGADPVLFANAYREIAKMAPDFFDEIPEMAGNEEMNFLDFKKIQGDIEKFKQNPDVKVYQDLLYTIFNAKRIYEIIRGIRHDQVY